LSWGELSMGRVVRRASCPWGELSEGRVVMGRVVHGASCPWGELSLGRVVPGASCPWGELSMGRVVPGASCRGASFDGASCPLGELSWASGPGTFYLLFPTRLLTSEDEYKWYWHQVIYFPETINTISTTITPSPIHSLVSS
jgi:hypothetical protein